MPDWLIPVAAPGDHRLDARVEVAADLKRQGADQEAGKHGGRAGRDREYGGADVAVRQRCQSTGPAVSTWLPSGRPSTLLTSRAQSSRRSRSMPVS